MALALYLLTYVGAFKINDERALFSSMDSLWKRGEFTTNQIYWDYTNVGMLTTTGEMVPNYEPAQIVLALPLYLWGLALDATVQAVMMWGALVTAASVAMVYLTVLELGYGRRTSALAAFVFGAGTIVWAYSKTFYRDPLAMLAYQVAIYALLRYRPPRGRGWMWPAVMGTALGVALTTKQVSVALIPALLLLVAVYEWRRPGRMGERVRTALAALIPLAVILLLYHLYYQQTLAGVELFARDLSDSLTNPQLSSSDLSRMTRAALGLTISPFRGVFWYAPVLLLALVGVIPFLRRHPWEGMAFGGIFVAHLIGYSRYLHWAGGAAWGSRYMLATIPFLVILAAPVFAWLVERPDAKRSLGERLAAAGIVLIIALSVAIQIPGVTIDMVTFEHQYFAEQGPIWGGIGEAIDATYLSPASSAVLGNFRLLRAGTEPLDVAWVQRRDQGTWAFASAALLLSLFYLGLTVAVLFMMWRRSDMTKGLGAGLAVVTVAVMSLLLTIYREGDGRFDPYNVDRFLEPMLATLEEAPCEPRTLGEPRHCDAVMIVPDPLLTDYFLSYLRAPLPWYALPTEPATEDIQLLDQLVQRYPTILLVRDRSAAADDTQGRRTVERYLTEHTNKVTEEQIESWARLIRFSAAGTPTERLADTQSLGEMTLVGAELRIQDEQATPLRVDEVDHGPDEPLADGQVQAETGDVLQIDLRWRADASPEANYTVFVQLLDSALQVALQRDRWPGDGLYPTASLEVGQTITDNLALPLDLPPGSYRLIVGLYRNDIEGFPRLIGPAGDHIELAEVEIQ